MELEFTVVTDTATLAIFDLQAIRHRITDTFDWWSIQSDELFEMNEGNIAFLNLGEDGKYLVRVLNDITSPMGGAFLKVPSGVVFVGAGEDTTGGDLEPDGSDAVQGAFVNLAVGSYYVKYGYDEGAICLAFTPSTDSQNDFSDSIRLG
ncbi:DUF6386 family protein [Pseudomonas sp. NPDC089395]|uniref:DUF6386 family protein n=1 Tax=Pseudomonas sp. NPDC089395 TaxID=3364460 RepID=UPI0037FDC7A0